MSERKNVNRELGRIREMMTYGLNEGKKNTPFSDVEYSRVGADGKLYGIVREGTKYYIKSADASKQPVKENFEYIGGFMNRKNNEYSSYANALKNFDLKMSSLKEANSPDKKIVVESWNPDKRQQLTVEATNEMKREIRRERQIMRNASRIDENKSQECDCCGDPFCKSGEKCGASDMDIEKCQDNIGKNPDKNGRRKGYPMKSPKGFKKAGIPSGVFGEGRSDGEVLGWNDDYDYIDDSHGTEIGDDAPFTKKRFTNRVRMDNGVVGEGKAMHREFWNQNSPKPGTNGRGRGVQSTDDPFNKSANGSMTEEGWDDEDYMNEAIEGVDASVDGGAPQGGLMGRIANMEDTLNNIANVLGADVSAEDGDMGAEGMDMGGGMMPPMGGPEMGGQEMGGGMPPMGGQEMGGAMPPMGGQEMGGGMPPMGGQEMGGAQQPNFNDGNLYPQQANESRVYESRDFRRMMNEDRLDYFGKHPAYQKKVMTYPTFNHQEFPGYHDWNDESLHSESPYGEQIGDGAPFMVDPDELENAIAESIIRNLKKK